MKKIWGVLLAAAMMMAMGVCAMAGTFDGYWDFMQEDGTYAYGFPRVLVSMDKTWYRNTRVVVGEEGRTASFYHKDSYNAYAEEGMVGGLLFTIGASVNTDFEDLPHFVYLGFDEEEAMNYYASLPTDYQAYMGDDAIRNEYDELWSGVEDVLDSVVIKGSEKFRDMIESDDVDQPEFLTSGDYCYSINDGTAVIVKYNGAEEILEVPSEIDGYPVTEIGAAAFWGKEMESLVIPDSISIIGERAFECVRITGSLMLPENVTIAYEAFSDARQLPESITIPAGALVEEGAFSYCDTVTEVTIGQDALVSSRAFIYCDALKQVTCGEGSRLETKAFEYCGELGKVILCEDAEAEEDAFLFCGDLEVTEKEVDPDEASPETAASADYEYSVSKGAVVIEKYNGDDVEVEIPSEIDGYPVAEIGDEAFRYRKLKSVSVPESISRIGRQAFEYCDITDALELPENVTIGKDAFSYAVLPSEVIIPAGATVEECAFSYCEVMEKVCIEPGAVLKGRAFDYCDDLLLAVIAEGSRLEEDAFEICRGMKRAVLCGDVTTVEESFSGCGDAEITKTEAGEYETLKLAALEELVDLTPYEEEPRVLEIRNSPATLDGVTVTLENAVAERDPYTGAFTYTLGGTIENNSDEGIMQVVYTFALIDENGEEFRSFSLVYDGEDTALPPQAKADFFRDDIKWGKQSLPAAVEIGISSVETETELPPVHVPQTGEYLYQALGDEKLAKIREEAPVELSFHVDQGGYGRTATFGEGDALDWAVELLCEIKIGEESGEWVTDNYNWIRLKWADGSYTGISLNLSNLEYWAHSTPHTFELEKLGEFWSFCEKYLEEDDPYDEVEDAEDYFGGSTDAGMS